jgi:hypothetical protein
MAAGSVAAHAAAVNALKASGVVVRLEPHAWLALLARTGIFRKHVRYLTSYRGLAFYTQSDAALMLPSRAEVVQARSMSIPDV